MTTEILAAGTAFAFSSTMMTKVGADQNCCGRKVGVTVWGNRISPVFDSARNLLVATCAERKITSLSSLAFDPDRLAQLVQMLQSQNISVVICGAVSEGPAYLLEAAGIELIPFIAGDARMVLEHYVSGNPVWKQFTMPGCAKNICCRGKIRRGNELASYIPQGRTDGKEAGMIEIAVRPPSGKDKV